MKGDYVVEKPSDGFGWEIHRVESDKRTVVAWTIGHKWAVLLADALSDGSAIVSSTGYIVEAAS